MQHLVLRIDTSVVQQLQSHFRSCERSILDFTHLKQLPTLTSFGPSTIILPQPPQPQNLTLSHPPTPQPQLHHHPNITTHPHPTLLFKMPKGHKLIEWTAENDARLMLTVLAVENLHPNYEAVAAAFGESYAFPTSPSNTSHTDHTHTLQARASTPRQSKTASAACAKKPPMKVSCSKRAAAPRRPRKATRVKQERQAKRAV